MIIDLAGRRFGRLTVARRAANSPGGEARWLCVCDCGASHTASSRYLRTGQVSSCGCLRREMAAAKAPHRKKHGHNTRSHTTPTYRSWRSMIDRCTNPRQAKFHYYGGRGVSVCDRWRSFETFLADMGERPTGKTLDRINPNGNYEPGNCRWATAKEQVANRRPRSSANAIA